MALFRADVGVQDIASGAIKWFRLRLFSDDGRAQRYGRYRADIVEKLGV